MKTLSLSKHMEDTGFCPNCGEGDLGGSETCYEDGTLDKDCWCPSCGLHWVEGYTLTSIRDVRNSDTGERFTVVE